MLSPSLALARARILGYVAARHEGLPADHSIFDFGASLRPKAAEYALLVQLALASGLPPMHLGTYLAGTSPAMVEMMPELGWLRDLLFSMAMLCCPDGDKLPQVGTRARRGGATHPAPPTQRHPPSLHFTNPHPNQPQPALYLL